MSKTSITSAGGLGVYVVSAKTGRPSKRRPSQADNELDAESPDEPAPPPPGMGKFVDKTV